MKKLFFFAVLCFAVICTYAQEYTVLSVNKDNCFYRIHNSSDWNPITPGCKMDNGTEIKNNGDSDCEITLRYDNRIITVFAHRGLVKLSDAKVVLDGQNGAISFLDYIRENASRSLRSREVVYQLSIGGAERGASQVSGTDILPYIRPLCRQDGVFDPKAAFEKNCEIKVERADKEIYFINPSDDLVFVSVFSFLENDDGTVKFKATEPYKIYVLDAKSEARYSWPVDIDSTGTYIAIITHELVPPAHLDACMTSLCNRKIKEGESNWVNIVRL